MLPNTTSHPITPVSHTNNKENVLVRPLRNTNGRKPRSRPNNSPSPVFLTREAARDPRRRRTMSPPVAQKRSMRLGGEESMDVDMLDVLSPTQEESAPRNIQLPRHLRQPAFRDISEAALLAVDPELEGVSIEFIREGLSVDGGRLLAAAMSVKADPPKDRLPRELEVLIEDLEAPPPSHLFAVYSKTSNRVSLHPAHALVLAAHCANLPKLPPSEKEPTASGSDSKLNMVLPVLPLTLPNPPSFPMLLHYLYTKKIDHLLSVLLPTTTFGATQSVDQMTSHFAATFTISALLNHAARVHGLWTNVVALGVFDDKLWKAIEMVWGVLVGALAKSTGATWQPKTVPVEPKQSK